MIGVTVLTSMSDQDLAETGINVSADTQVSRLAGLAHKAGLDGVVCSPKEAALLRQELGPDFLLVTPGVRPAGASADDQTRVMTPVDAVRAGSDFLVIGRPVTQNDEMSMDRHSTNWRLIESDRYLDTCEFSYSLLDAFCLLFVDT